MNFLGELMLIQHLGNLGENIPVVQKQTRTLNQHQGLTLKPLLETDTFNKQSVSSTTVEKQGFLDSFVTFLGHKKTHKKKQKRQANKHHSQAQSKSHSKNQQLNSANDYERPVYNYKNMFNTWLKAESTPSLKALLAADGTIHNVRKSAERVSSLSRYLKEDMVGFITPDGKHWFEEALPYLYKGCAAEDIGPEKYLQMAETFWNLMVKADSYWKSPDFLEYLKSMQPSPAVKATINAVNNLMANESAMKMVAFTGYPSKIKYIPELNKCAYSGRSLEWNTDELHNPSAEHIFPHSIGGDNVNIDINYFVTSAQANSNRGNIPLLAFLKGWDADDYAQANHNKAFFNKIFD